MKWANKLDRRGHARVGLAGGDGAFEWNVRFQGEVGIRSDTSLA